MRRSGLGVAVVVGVGLGCAGAASAATVTLAPSKDNTLIETSPAVGELSNGQGAIFAGRTNQAAGSSLRRGLMAFDLSSIPAGSTVTAASLSLFAVQTRATGAINMSLFRVTRDWGEGASTGSGSGAPAAAGDAGWYHSVLPGQSWTNPGGDFVSTASATASLTGAGATYTWSGASMAADVQGWLNNPGTNFGWVLVGNETTNLTAYEFNSGEAATGGPALTVTYTAVPEPAALGVLALAAPWVGGRGRRRRRVPRA